MLSESCSIRFLALPVILNKAAEVRQAILRFFSASLLKVFIAFYLHIF
nr:MAG TPA: hypothetical protein [Caudoviricetes sp.]